MGVRVKICGITNQPDAQAATKAGADALGFIFFPKSPRAVEPGVAAEIIAEVPPFITRVGVFVNEPTGVVLAIARQSGIDTVQLHGEEPPEQCADLRKSGLKVVKALRVRDRAALNSLRDYRADAFLLDSYVPGQLGGTGEAFNWDLAIEARSFGTPIILAGGLTAETIADAIAKTQPFAVDVSSGVEISPGRKDHDKLRRFVRGAKAILAD